MRPPCTCRCSFASTGYFGGCACEGEGTYKCNRLLGMCVKMQNKVFDHFMAILEEKVRVAKQNGEFDDGVVDIRGESVKVGPPPRGAAPGDASRTPSCDRP